jgi:signal transduction histidine kinase
MEGELAQKKMDGLQHQIEFILKATGTDLAIMDSNYNMLYASSDNETFKDSSKKIKCYEYCSHRSDVCLECGLKTAFESKTIVTIDQVERKDSNDEIRYKEITLLPFKDMHDNWLVAELSIDRTEKNKAMKEKIILENKLQQTQKMEAIGILAGGIAHDFNNILFPILGHSEMLMVDMDKDSNPHVTIKKIHTGAIRAHDLVKQILTFSRQEESYAMEIKIQPIVKEALKFIRSTISSTIEINHNINPDCGSINADPTQIYQIVMNLTTNASYAMGKSGGRLDVSLQEVLFTNSDVLTPGMVPGRYACLCVSDTGKGMTKYLIEKIFNPFFTTKKLGRGTGMGLSVVHGIVTAIQGQITVKSAPDQGTVFKIYLPVIETKSQALQIPR